MRHRVVRVFCALAIAATALLAAGPSWAAVPVAVDDSYPSATGADLIIREPGVLTNDTDADGHPLKAVLDSGPTKGTLSLAGDGSFIYSPGVTFTGTDSFTYFADDGTDLSVLAATVTITERYPANTVLDGGCVNESNGLLNVCVANDLTFVELGLGVQSDGCVNPADRLTINMRSVLRNATAQARYDVGVWFPLPDPAYPDPGAYWDYIIDPEGDGALTGVCGSIGFMNPEPFDPLDTTTPTELCYFDTPVGALDLAGNEYGVEFGHGPWANDDGKTDYDACADLFDDGHTPGCDQNADSDWDDSIIHFDSPLTIDCNDTDQDGLTDGFVSTPVCLSWGNQPNQVDDTALEDPVNGGNGLCDVLSELKPGTKSKCRCEDFQLTNIPSPDLGIACTMPTGFTTVRPGSWVTVSITYTNSCTCVPDTDPTVPDRFKCCTASYIRFPITYNSAVGSITNIDRPTEVTDDGAGTLIWTPETAAVSPGTGIIAQSDTAVLTFDYNVDPLAPDPGTDLVNVGTVWANDPDFTIEVNQASLSSSCNVLFNSTWAAISNVGAEVREGRTVVSWESSAEVGTVGYDVFRSDAAGGRWVKVNQTLVPALGDGPGGRYEFVDRDAPSEGVVTYKIREMDAWGEELETRPVAVNLRETGDAAPQNDVVMERRQPSDRIVRNLEKKTPKARRVKDSTVVRRVPGSSRLQADRPTLVKIGVAETGLYRVSAAEIATAMGDTEAKIETRIGQHKFALTTGGQPVAWQAEPDASGVVFYGQAPDSLYDTEKFYVLSVGPGLVIEEADTTAPPPTAGIGSFREQIAFERDLLMRPFNVIDEGVDFWFWNAVLAEDPVHGEKVLEIELADVSVSDGTAGLKMSIVGFAPGTQARGSVFVNDNYVGDLYGPILIGTEAVFGFNQSQLINGINTVKVVGRNGGMLINRLEVAYDRVLYAVADELTVRNPGTGIVSVDKFSIFDVEVFDVSDPLRPAAVPSNKTLSTDGSSVVVSFEPSTGSGTYLAVAADAVRTPQSIAGRAKSELRKNWTGADYVIVTTADLASAADRLAAHRQDTGLDSMVVDVEDIFDDFTDGERDPAAIKAFLTYAAANWATQPRYVLLAGRGHYDYKDLMGYGGNLLPPMLTATDRGLIPSDNEIADLNGDGMPDLAIGRLPVLNAEELDAAIDKIIAYENEPMGDWAKQVMLAADDPDDAGEFRKSGDKLALSVPDDREVEKVYLFDPYLASEVNNIMVGALEEGLGIINWTGHAGLDSLANERVMTNDDLKALEGTAHPSVFVGLSCLINNFGFPYFATFGEEMALVPGGGAIGVWAASGLSNNTHAEVLGEKFMEALGGDGLHRLGDIIQSAIKNYVGPYTDRDLVNEYVLFGDPALELK